mgnify:CR=1 FL=1
MIGFDIMDYTTSPFNPLLKVIIFILFAVTIVVYYDTRRSIGGEIQKTIDILLIFSIFMALGSFFRYFGHGTDFGFDSDYSLKWLQSIAYLCGAISFIFAALKLLNLFRRRHE